MREVEASHNLSLLHVIIKINQQLVDLPGELGTHFCCYHRMQRSGHVQARSDVTDKHGGGQISGGVRGKRRLSSASRDNKKRNSKKD